LSKESRKTSMSNTASPRQSHYPGCLRNYWPIIHTK